MTDPSGPVAAGPTAEQLIEALADDVGNANRRHVVELLEAAVGLVSDHPSRLDLKIASAALTEMRQAFATFAPYHDRRKVTVFGSARTTPDSPTGDNPAGDAPDLDAESDGDAQLEAQIRFGLLER